MSAPSHRRTPLVGIVLSTSLAVLLSVGCDSRGRIGPAASRPLPPGAPGVWQDLGLSNGFVQVEALAVWDGKWVAGGTFYDVQGHPSTSLATWEGTSWTRLGPDFGGSVSALTVWDGKLLAGGNFPHINGDTIRYVGAWDGHEWSPLGSGPDRSVTSLAVYGGALIAGGSFETAGGVPVAFIAR